MKKFFKKIFSSITVSVVGGIIGLISIFGGVIGAISYYSFENAFKQEYATATFHMARSSVLYVNGNHIDEYLSNQYVDEYNQTTEDLYFNCRALNVSIIYVIKVDTTDYNSFTSVFNVVYNEVDNTSYKPWSLGYHQATTNDEYKTKYKNLYEQKTEYETLFRVKVAKGQHPHITTLVPVKNSIGEVTSLLCIQRPIKEMRAAFAPYFLYIAIGVASMGILIIIVSILFLRNAIIKPILKVSKETVRFSKENTEAKKLGKISRFEDFQNLAQSVDTMEEEMVSYIDNITKITAEKEKLGAELTIASQIQQSSLPNPEGAFKDRDDFEVYASMDPAKEVGGDFYNFLLLDDDHLALVIADVSDKGVPAALFMMVTNILISERAKVFKNPALVLDYVNNDLCEHNQNGMFVTIWLGILEISTGTLVTSNAGHEDPYVYRKGKYFELIKEQHGFVLGAMKGLKYINEEIKLNKGDKVFVYTDGLSEANNEKKEQYSMNRIQNALNRNKDKSPKEILINIQKDVSEFVKDSPQFDDLTMLCVEIK